MKAAHLEYRTVKLPCAIGVSKLNFLWAIRRTSQSHPLPVLTIGFIMVLKCYGIGKILALLDLRKVFGMIPSFGRNVH
jgi:hypothetical protein